MRDSDDKVYDLATHIQLAGIVRRARRAGLARVRRIAVRLDAEDRLRRAQNKVANAEDAVVVASAHAKRGFLERLFGRDLTANELAVDIAKKQYDRLVASELPAAFKATDVSVQALVGEPTESAAQQREESRPSRGNGASTHPAPAPITGGWQW